MKARIKFTKVGPVKFVGHLDIMRYFHKAIRRSGIEIEYSKGFSPHQIISFATPLGVGLTSDAEYLDMQLVDKSSYEGIIDKLNAEMTTGIELLSFKELPEGSKNAMSIVAAADYLVSLKDGYEITPDFTLKFNEFYQQNSISILKKTKKSEKEIDIKPFIYHISFDKDEFLSLVGQTEKQNESKAEIYNNGNIIYMQLAAGSVNNLKPDLVLEAFCNYVNIPFNEYAFQYHRLEMYADMENETERRLISLNDIGTEVV